LAENPIEEWAKFFGEKAGDPWDWGSFGWGMLAGGIVTLVVEGVALYFTWPALIAFLKGIFGAEVVREVVK